MKKKIKKWLNKDIGGQEEPFKDNRQKVKFTIFYICFLSVAILIMLKAGGKI